MNIKIIFFILLFVTNIFAVDFNLKNLSKKDIETLKEIKKLGQKQGLSYSLMAIAIKESSLGKYLINVDSRALYLCCSFLESTDKPTA